MDDFIYINPDLLREYGTRVESISSLDQTRYTEWLTQGFPVGSATGTREHLGWIAAARWLTQNGESGVLVLHLDRGTVRELDPEDQRLLLHTLLEDARGANNTTSARDLVRRFALHRAEQERFSLLAFLFTDTLYSYELLSFLRRSYPDIAAAELLDEIVTDDGSETNTDAFDRVVQVYGDQPAEVYYSLMQNALQAGNDKLYHHVGYSHYSQISPFAPKPDWIVPPKRDADGNELDESQLFSLLPEAVLPADFGSIHDLAAAISEDDVRDVEQVEALIRRSPADEIKLVSDEKRKEIGRQLLAYQDEITRIAGPANPTPGQNLAEDHECSNWGGDRMFICLCHERFNEDDDVEIPLDEAQWWTGFCLWCYRQIASPYYASRRREVGGGWSGCYCSPEHSIADITHRFTRNRSCLFCASEIEGQCEVFRKPYTSAGAWGCFCSQAHAQEFDDSRLLVYPRLTEVWVEEIRRTGVYERQINLLRWLPLEQDREAELIATTPRREKPLEEIDLISNDFEIVVGVRPDGNADPDLRDVIDREAATAGSGGTEESDE